MRPTPALVFFLSKGQIIAYDLIQHDYYEVDNPSFELLKKLSLDQPDLESPDWEPFKELGINQLFVDVPWKGDPFSHIAHQSSRIHSKNTEVLSKEQFVQQYTEVSAQASSIPIKELPLNSPIVALPNPSLQDLYNTSLGNCFEKRKTSRTFIDKPISLNHISTILYSCFAPIHGEKRQEFRELGLKDLGYRRSSPSSTGLASCQAILWGNNITSLEKGLYCYDEENHQLLKLSQEMTVSELIYGMLDQFWIEDLAAGIFIVNDLRRTWIKDIMCRGYLASHQEAGHISQNVLLTATALELNTWLSGSFRDDFLNQKLDLPSYRFVSLFVGFGEGQNQAISQNYLNLLNKL